MSLAELNRYNFRFNALPNTTPSGMYGIILKNSNATISNNLLLNSEETIKANFGIFDNSNLLCLNNNISGAIAKLQGNSYVSEYNNIINAKIPNISINCNSFLNFPSKLVSGDLATLEETDEYKINGFVSPISS